MFMVISMESAPQVDNIHHNITEKDYNKHRLTGKQISNYYPDLTQDIMKIITKVQNSLSKIEDESDAYQIYENLLLDHKFSEGHLKDVMVGFIAYHLGCTSVDKTERIRYYQMAVTYFENILDNFTVCPKVYDILFDIYVIQLKDETSEFKALNVLSRMTKLSKDIAGNRINNMKKMKYFRDAKQKQTKIIEEFVNTQFNFKIEDQPKAQTNKNKKLDLLKKSATEQQFLDTITSIPDTISSSNSPTNKNKKKKRKKKNKIPQPTNEIETNEINEPNESKMYEINQNTMNKLNLDEIQKDNLVQWLYDFKDIRFDTELRSDIHGNYLKLICYYELIRTKYPADLQFVIKKITKDSLVPKLQEKCGNSTINILYVIECIFEIEDVDEIHTIIENSTKSIKKIFENKVEFYKKPIVLSHYEIMNALYEMLISQKEFKNDITLNSIKLYTLFEIYECLMVQKNVADRNTKLYNTIVSKIPEAFRSWHGFCFKMQECVPSPENGFAKERLGFFMPNVFGDDVWFTKLYATIRICSAPIMEKIQERIHGLENKEQKKYDTQNYVKKITEDSYVESIKEEMNEKLLTAVVALYKHNMLGELKQQKK